MSDVVAVVESAGAAAAEGETVEASSPPMESAVTPEADAAPASQPAEVALQDEAANLSPLLHSWTEMYQTGQLASYDLAGAYILAYLAYRHRHSARGCICARMTPPVLAEDVEHATVSARIEEIPGLHELLGGPQYLARWVDSGATLVQLFSRARFRGIKKHSNDFANKSICEWACGNRPFQLLFFIPSPMKVLRMQAGGDRVVTMFVLESELCRRHTSQLHYMEGEQTHARDPLHFLVHDLAHMEHFVDERTRAEQIGFFQSMLALQPSPRQFLDQLGGDLKLWRQIEYVIADFNAPAKHLLGYLKAKLISCCVRRCPEGPHPSHCDVCEQQFRGCWVQVLAVFGMATGSAAQMAADALCLRPEPLDAVETQALRDFFVSKAQDAEAT